MDVGSTYISAHALLYFSKLCIDFAGELSGSHLVTSGLQLSQVAGESGEENSSST